MDIQNTLGRFPRGLIAIALIVTLSGCASLSADDCQSADWLQIGQKDGARGYSSSRINSHVSACKKHDVKVNQSQYKQGRKLGLKTFCEASNGYRYASEKREYKSVCPSNLEAGFLREYVKGLNDVISDLDNDRSRARSALDRARDAEPDDDTEKLDKRVKSAQTKIDNIDKEQTKLRGWLRHAINRL